MIEALAAVGIVIAFYLLLAVCSMLRKPRDIGHRVQFYTEPDMPTDSTKFRQNNREFCSRVQRNIK